MELLLPDRHNLLAQMGWVLHLDLGALVLVTYCCLPRVELAMSTLVLQQEMMEHQGVMEVMVRVRRHWARDKRSHLGRQLLDMTRIGLLYGLLLEGFKLL